MIVCSKFNAQLNYNNNFIQQTRIAIAKIPFDFLLLAANKPLNFKLEQVLVQTVKQQQQAYEWLDVNTLTKLAKKQMH
jgi:hypothetical protein